MFKNMFKKLNEDIKNKGVGQTVGDNVQKGLANASSIIKNNMNPEQVENKETTTQSYNDDGTEITKTTTTVKEN